MVAKFRKKPVIVEAGEFYPIKDVIFRETYEAVTVRESESDGS